MKTEEKRKVPCDSDCAAAARRWGAKCACWMATDCQGVVRVGSDRGYFGGGRGVHRCAVRIKFTSGGLLIALHVALKLSYVPI